MSEARARRASWAVAAGLALGAGAAPSQPRDPRFVRVEGRQFFLGDRRFRFTGANASVMHGPVHREATEAILDAAVADGLRVVRVWALGERPEGAPTWTRDFAFRLGEDGWVRESFEHLDRVLAAAARRGLKVIVVLANRWGDYGGVPQYLAWAGIDLAAQRRLGESGALAAFFGDASARAQYLAHVARVVTRVNSLTGIAYRDDPTIMAWELVNEVDAAPRDLASLLDWTRDNARAIHQLDRSHLVAAGHIGYASRAQRQTWLAVQSLPEIDYADAHAYPTRLHSVRSLRELDDFIDDHAALARHVAQKPLVWGEFGFTTGEARHLGLPRAQWYQRFLARAHADDADGAMVWLYTASRDAPRELGIFADEAAASSAEIRGVMRAASSAWERFDATINPRVLARAAEPLWRTDRIVRGPARRPAAPTRTARGLRWSLAPERFFDARAERLGRWDGYAVMHLWASGVARIRYQLSTPGAPPGARYVALRVRASSELPGRGEGSRDDEVSRVLVRVDEEVMGEFVAPRDDGIGRWIELRSERAEAVRALSAPGTHTLTLEVVEGADANGLCLYGHATGREPVPGDAGELPGRVELSLVR